MRELRVVFALAGSSLVLIAGSGCNGSASGQGSWSSNPNDTIREIKAEEARLEGQLEAGRREAQGTWGQPDPGYQTPEQMGFQPR